MKKIKRLEPKNHPQNNEIKYRVTKLKPVSLKSSKKKKKALSWEKIPINNIKKLH